MPTYKQSQSCVMSNFCGTEIEIWAGFEPVDSTEKKIGPIKTFEGFFFHVFRGKKLYFLKDIVASKAA